MIKKETKIIENHPHDSRIKVRDGGPVQTLNGRMGTGGGNTPMVLESDEDKLRGGDEMEKVNAVVRRLTPL